MAIEIRQLPCLSDNYGYLVQDQETGAVASIDSPDPHAINTALQDAGWRLTHILNTHHHFDHAGGNLALKEKWNCKIIGPRAESEEIPGLDIAAGEGDVISLGASKAKVYDTPGHTLGHIVYHFEADGAAFVGDTIFALGCGRLFEGTPAQMYNSLAKIAAWPDNDLLYCAHEYSQANARFAVTVDPQNNALSARAEEIDLLRRRGQPTVPSSVAQERATNPFLRSNDPGVQATVGMSHADPIDVFAEIRKRKDKF